MRSRCVASMRRALRVSSVDGASPHLTAPRRELRQPSPPSLSLTSSAREPLLRCPSVQAATPKSLNALDDDELFERIDATLQSDDSDAPQRTALPRWRRS